MSKVVVTGIGGLTSLGNSWEDISANIQNGQGGITFLSELAEYKGLRTRLSGKIIELEIPQYYERKHIRSMSRGALMSVVASENAIKEAALSGSKFEDDCGVAYGCCLAGPNEIQMLSSACENKNFCGITATSYLKVMSHSFASSISLFFGLKGRLIPSGSACTSASQSIGYAFENIKNGNNKLMIAGGAEEFCIGLLGLFDSMGATSIDIDPSSQPRPFDQSRNGIVLSEGACSFLLEDSNNAMKRGAPVIAEVAGFATNCCTQHITQLDKDSMVNVMQMALKSAGISAEDIGLVHLHGTATEAGDICESQATYEVFGNKTPVTALKSYFGHTLGACGGIESWCCINMLNEGWIAPIKNLTQPDSRCADLNFVMNQQQSINTPYIMVNNFAFGGVNTSLIFKKI